MYDVNKKRWINIGFSIPPYDCKSSFISYKNTKLAMFDIKSFSVYVMTNQYIDVIRDPKMIFNYQHYVFCEKNEFPAWKCITAKTI